jgi:hypothetical protein
MNRCQGLLSKTTCAATSRRAAPASHLKEALLAALPMRAVRLVMAAVLAGHARPGPEAGATTGAAAAAAAAARLCACSNSVCHAVLQAGWGDGEDGGGGSGGGGGSSGGGGGVAGCIDAEARYKLGAAAAAALSTTTPDGSAVETIPRASAVALRCMLTSAHSDDNGRVVQVDNIKTCGDSAYGFSVCNLENANCFQRLLHFFTCAVTRRVWGLGGVGLGACAAPVRVARAGRGHTMLRGRAHGAAGCA